MDEAEVATESEIDTMTTGSDHRNEETMGLLAVIPRGPRPNDSLMFYHGLGVWHVWRGLTSYCTVFRISG